MNLLPTNEIINNCPALIETEQRYVIARQSTMVRDLTETELYAGMVIVIGNMFKENGGIPSKEQNEKDLIDRQSTAMVRELKLYFKTMTIAEIRIAFEMGVREDLGKYFGLSITTYNKWCKKYLALPERVDSFRKWQHWVLQEESKPEHVPTELEKLQIMQEGCINFLNDFFKLKRTEGFLIGNIHYDYLLKLDVIAPKMEKRRQCFEKARTQMMSDVEYKRKRGNFKAIEAQAALQKLSDDSDVNLHALAKRIYLQEFLEYIVEMKLQHKLLTTLENNYAVKKSALENAQTRANDQNKETAGR